MTFHQLRIEQLFHELAIVRVTMMNDSSFVPSCVYYTFSIKW